MICFPEILLEYVIPVLGVIVANLMFLAPYRDLQTAISNGTGLNSLNPTPWAFMLGNCLGWTAYGIIANDWCIFWSDFPGFLVSVWLNLGAVKLLYLSHHQNETRESLVTFLTESCEEKKDFVGTIVSCLEETDGSNRNASKKNKGDKDKEIKAKSLSKLVPERIHDNDDGKSWGEIAWEITSQKTPAKTHHEQLVVIMVLVWTVLLSLVGFYGHYTSLSNAGSVAKTIVGYAVNANMIFFYGAPLSKIHKVIQTKTSDALHFQTMLTNLVHAVLWTAYGLAPQINDPFIYVPCGLGLVFSVIQLVLWMIYPRSTNEKCVENEQLSTPPVTLCSEAESIFDDSVSDASQEHEIDLEAANASIESNVCINEDTAEEKAKIVKTIDNQVVNGIEI